MDNLNSYVSSLGKAIELLRNGYSLPLSLARDLAEQGYDVLALQAAHLNQKD